MTNAELAVLGLIAERPRHGYEIEQVIEARGMRDWTEVAFSSIYYLLRKLEAQKFIRGRLQQQPGKGPARKVYRITNQGRRAWQDATLQALSSPEGSPEPFLLGLVGIPGIPTRKVVESLRRYRERLLERRDYIHARWRSAGEDLPLFLEGMFDFSVNSLEARAHWVEGFIARLQVAQSDGLDQPHHHQEAEP